ncbi:MCP four helix bundle domain-containing protein, partial [Goekera deserti]
MKTKVLAVGAVGAVVAGVIGVTGLSALGGSADRTAEMFERDVVAIGLLGEVANSSQQLRIDGRDAVLAPPGAPSQAALDAQLTHADELRAHLAALLELDLTDEQRAQVQSISDTLEEIMVVYTTVLAPLAVSNQYDVWYATNGAQVRPLVLEMVETAEALRDGAAGDAAASAAAAADSYAAQRTQTLVALALGIAVAMGLGLFVATGIARSASRVRDTAVALAAGDLTASSGLTTDDELGQMGRALDEAMGSLRAVMGSVVASAEAVAASSEELSASSAQISASAEETSAQSGVVSAA